jgi:DnaK suppressor protein
MKHLNPNFEAEVAPQWRWHRRTLRRMRERLVREADELRAALRLPVERGGSDTCDVATDKAERDDLLAGFNAEQAELSEVDAALERLRQGTYGLCEDTGEAIEVSRLRAIPWTRYSLAAATRRERQNNPFSSRLP